MAEMVLSFYEELADAYHLIFADWDEAIARQARTIEDILAARLPGDCWKILDCACGIGTQALGLAALGHEVVGSDLSPAAVERAQQEAASRGLEIAFHVADMTSLDEVAGHDFDVTLAMDNALPHLSESQLKQAVAAMGARLKPGGLFVASMRDYDTLIRERPRALEPQFYGEGAGRRIVFQVWDWAECDRYTLHLHITERAGEGWRTRSFVSEYRCLQRAELGQALLGAGFTEVLWLMPEESGFYQPVVVARRPA